MPINDDIDAWYKYPHHRIWFNKLWLSEQLGYCCGPGGIPVPKDDYYCVRPIYNIRGMGAGARIIKIKPDDLSLVEPGYFWCQVFEGDHLTFDLEWVDNQWRSLFCFQGLRTEKSLYKFNKWIRINSDYRAPEILNTLYDCKYINIETIDNKIIEVHLRVNPDPKFQEIIPVWENDVIKDMPGYKYVDAPCNADGFIDQKRLGFFVK